MVNLHPGEKCGAHVEAEELVIIGDVLNAVATQVENPGESVGAVALIIDPVIPIGKRLGAGLVVDDPRPGVFPGGLVKMSVNDERSRHVSSFTYGRSVVKGRF